jgi:hypothetical protein
VVPGVVDIGTAGQHSNGGAAGCQGGTVGACIDAVRPAGHNGPSVLGQVRAHRADALELFVREVAPALGWARTGVQEP